ncbi:MAG TPA: efflux RND transporter periplasmic adaptor subunit [Gammaproteobacteria bacterium]|nr:efflux RND transporter periplasmic adaptor subunit [Gammaproteobacteria bacterium]
MTSAAEVPFATVSAVYETAPRERIWDGTVEAVNQATVSAQTSGRVAEILYDVDDFVEAGAVIMRFTDTEQRAAIVSARAALQETEARVAEAESEYRRIAALFESGTVAKARHDQALANYDAAQARLQSARAGVSAAQEQLDYTLVRAPYAGIVSERHVELGEMVRPGQPLMSGLSLQQVRVSVDVPQTMIDPIRRIGRATVYADPPVAGESLTFFPIADPDTNTFRVRVNLPEGSATLYPGTFVKVGFVIGETQRLLVPVAAVVHRSELTAVYVVDGDRVTLRQIRAGRQFGDRVEVLAGLAPGETVAAEPVAAGVFLQEQRAP